MRATKNDGRLTDDDKGDEKGVRCLKSVNIKKISQLAGVSPTAVSFVLNNREGVSEETRRKVQEIIKQEGYIPNINSRRLSMKRSFNIAFINSETYAMFTDAFANGTVKAAVCKANSMGYNIMLLPEMNLKNRDYLTTVIGQGDIDGALVMHDIDPVIYATLKENKIPMVAIDSHMQNPPYPCIMMRYEELAYQVCMYLIGQGHRDIAFLGIESLPEFYLRCLKGYQRALSEKNLPIRAEWILSAADDGINVPEAVQNTLKEKLSREHLPTAIFCVNDLTAIGAISGLVQMGASVPEDVSIISIDDISVAKYYIPPLTTLRVDTAYMGEKAVEILHNIIEGKSEGEVFCMDAGELIVRKSVHSLNP